MDYGYIIKLSSKKIYREIQLPIDCEMTRIGMDISCDVRLYKEDFFESFQLDFSKKNNVWQIVCSENIFVDAGDVRKLVSKSLKHGDTFVIKYQNSEQEVCKIEFLYDFDNEKKNYDRIIDISNSRVVTIGSVSNSNIVLNSQYVQNDSIALQTKGKDLVLLINQTNCGVYHNGKKAKNKEIIKNGDFISIADFSFYYKNGKLMTEASDRLTANITFFDEKSKGQYPKFNRNTRIKTELNTDKIEVLDPPSKPQKPSGNIILQLLPALAMIALTIVVRGFMGNSSNSSFIIFSVCSMGLGIVTSVITMITDRKKYKTETAERIKKYNEYIDTKRNAILNIRNEELSKLNEMFISPDVEVSNVEKFSGDLFDKTNTDKDFLRLRVGWGSVEAKRVVTYKKQERFETDDVLVNLPENLYNETKFIENAPVTLDLKNNNVVGVVGNNQANYSFAKNLVLDICSRHYHSDVAVYFLISEENVSLYSEWLRWLPHIYDKNTQVRRIVYNDNSKNLIFENLYVELNKRNQEKKVNAIYNVVFVLDDWGIKTHPVSQFIEKANMLKTSFIFFENEKSDLPLNCGTIINLNNGKGTIIDTETNNNSISFQYSEIDDSVLKNVSLLLSPVFCEEISLENALTKNITLYELLNILSAEDIDLKQRWEKSEIYKTMSAPIGVKTKDEIVYLDLHEKAHGPHGLVAGTTGSGKSEILQTYILSMATLFHPYEVGFVIIDFKGGGMVNQFKDLPHLIGSITNIDGREIDRSLSSIKAELNKRQRLFAEYDVNNINNYIKLYKSGKTNIPIPHLILIVDEFAELKAEQPEFMKELISAARIGRSLGVHLILATQKPAGQVNEQIWSNSKFKLCLKVQTKEDSNEVIKSPLASEIKEPGRAYLQVGNNEIFELFQSAYSGAPASNDEAANMKKFSVCDVDLCGRRKLIYQQKPAKSSDAATTQLSAIVSYIHNYCKKNNIDKLSNICLPPLPDVIHYESKSDISKNDIILPIGVYDDPDNQAQELTYLNISSGNVAIIGSSQYGKTNLIQLIIRNLADNYSADEVNIYILDFGSMALKVFDNLNHIGGVVTAGEDEKIKNFFRLIMKEIKLRKEKFSKLGITSFHSYKEAGYTDIPQIVVFADNFIALKELYSDYEDELLTLCREGISLGICVIFTSIQTNGISYKYMSNFSNKIALYCNSSDEYGSLFDRCRMQPKSIPGRGIIQIDKTVYEFQSYLSFEGEREIDRVKDIKNFINSINKVNAGKFAKKIPEIPQKLNCDYVRANYQSSSYSMIPVGIDYESVDFVEFDLNKIAALAIAGKEKSGKTNFVKGIINHLQNNIFDFPSKVYLVDSYDRQLEEFSDLGCVEQYTIDANEIDIIFSSFEEELKERKELIQEEGPAVLDTMPLLVCVIENQSIFESNLLPKQAIDCYKRIISSYKQLKVLIVFSNVPNVNVAYGAPEMLKQIKDINVAVAFEDISNIKLFDFTAAVARQFKKPIEIGDGYKITSDGSISKIRTINYNEE